MNLDIISSNKSFGGWHKQYRHRSNVLGCEMRFAIYLPPQALTGQKVPCSTGSPVSPAPTRTSCRRRGPAYRRRARHRPPVAPDTSPAAKGWRTIPVMTSAWGRVSTSTPPRPWRDHYQMYDYVTRSCPSSSRPTSRSRRSAPSAATPWGPRRPHRRPARTRRSLPLGVGLQPHQPPPSRCPCQRPSAPTSATTPAVAGVGCLPAAARHHDSPPLPTLVDVGWTTLPGGAARHRHPGRSGCHPGVALTLNRHIPATTTATTSWRASSRRTCATPTTWANRPGDCRGRPSGAAIHKETKDASSPWLAMPDQF